MSQQSGPGIFHPEHPLSMPANPKLFRALGAVVALALRAVPLASAQTETTGETAQPAAPAQANPNASPAAEMARFGTFLDQHPAIEARLRENAGLLNDPVFLKNHPQLGTFLTNHPKIKSELVARPRWFLHREITRPVLTPAPANPRQIAEFDKLLDQHPEVASQLAQHPQLLRQPQFLNSHPELRDYVKQHPEIVRSAAPKAAPQNRAPATKAPAPAQIQRPAGEKSPAVP